MISSSNNQRRRGWARWKSRVCMRVFRAVQPLFVEEEEIEEEEEAEAGEGAVGGKNLMMHRY